MSEMTLEQVRDILRLAEKGWIFRDGKGGSYTLHDLADTIDAEIKRQASARGEAIGEAGSMPGTDGFTMAVFKATDIPIGTKLYTAPPGAAVPDR